MPRQRKNGCRLTALASWLLALVVGAIAGPAHAHAPVLQRELPGLGEYLRLGVAHILTGYDHLAFLIGLVLLGGSRRALLWAVSAFTLSHSLSLGLAVLDVVTPPAAWIEVAIALSIAYVGVENFVLRDGRLRWRITLAFGFIHGFGFAGALREIGVPGERAAAALLCFNVGVELGQLSILALAIPALAWLRGKLGSWTRFVSAMNGALIAVGVVWGVQRAVGPSSSGSDAGQASSPPPGVRAAQAPRVLASVSGSDLSPVYPRLPVQRGDAEQLCEVFQRLPRERRAACSDSATGVTFERPCSQVVSAALASGALQISPDDSRACQRTWRARYADCASMNAIESHAADSCWRLWRGQISLGGTCRSSLECEDGLACNGVGPFDAGVCTKPKSSGASCGRSIDVLAAYVPHDEAKHPECEGNCVRGRCQSAPSAAVLAAGLPSSPKRAAQARN